MIWLLLLSIDPSSPELRGGLEGYIQENVYVRMVINSKHGSVHECMPTNAVFTMHDIQCLAIMGKRPKFIFLALEAKDDILY